jgi:hypothetical protein
VSHTYQVLTEQQRVQLRLERARALEADICRAELQAEDAQSDAERDSLASEIELLRRRLEPHLVAMGLLVPERRGGSGSAQKGDDRTAGDGIPTPG